MTFRELNIKEEYRSFSDNVVKDFYIPAMSKSVMYKRAVGFFSSSALIEISRGITGIINNGGKIFLISSPILQAEDIEAINKGYTERKKVLERVLFEAISEPKTYFEEERLNILANLIAEGRLDIKIALTESNNSYGMYHEKMGLLYDNENNIIAFSGSMNESNTAFMHNYEAIDVFCSWKDELERVISKEKAFNNMWNDYDPGVRVFEFPKIAKDKLINYKKANIRYDIDNIEFGEVRETPEELENKGPIQPEDVSLYDYQKEAIEEWANRKFVGIFDMATGTGKTYTALGAITKLYDHCDRNLAVIIVCPFQHLVEQWVDDVKKFYMKPIIGYSASGQKDWKKRLKHAVNSFNLGIKNHFCFVTTNATFSSQFVQNTINELNNNAVLVIDEAHNFGAANLSRALNSNFDYRLALSATIDRHGDIEGTNKLYNYFGDKCIEYTLQRAIQEDKLVPYYYYPVVVYFTSEELEQYNSLSKEISKYCMKDKHGNIKVSENGKMLLIKRARIVASAYNKINKLEELIKDYKKDNHILVYCGATSIHDPGYEENHVNEFEMRQIDIVSSLLGNKLDMRISQFTSAEDSDERKRLKTEFAEGDHIQALIAIRCLDEGVNIPKIKTAFILASSTNPKEYIQRRGRVLRKAKGKNKAVIYDFITLPRPLNNVKSLSQEETKYDISLVKRELTRMEDFASIANNPSKTDRLINEINQNYGLLRIGGDVHGAL